MNTTKETIITIYNNVAGLIGAIGGWNVEVANDDIGTYLRITSYPDSRERRCCRGIALTDPDGGDDIDNYVWHFWNARGAWYESDLTADADEEEILRFLKDCLFEETLFEEEKHLLRAMD